MFLWEQLVGLLLRSYSLLYIFASGKGIARIGTRCNSLFISLLQGRVTSYGKSSQ